jgi:hypothetical protein
MMARAGLRLARRRTSLDPKEQPMAVAFVQEFDPGDRSTSSYDAVAARLDGVRPDGLLIHTAGFDDDAGVFRIFDVWESRGQGRRFIDEQLMPIINELMASEPEGSGGPPQRETFYELHDMIRP